MKITVKNAINTSDLKPSYNHSSWIDYWESQKHTTIRSARCPVCDKIFHRDDLVGAHIIKTNPDGNKLYITPICRGCNQSPDEFGVEEDSLISASKPIFNLNGV